ncbi:MAG TPA: malto-oligosyltrehalose synthase, partial [Gammaproteobacteria bacterium]|nr:malto-oligosyltrehalose synthase [Gammaproteobacteria bacterium]
TTFYVHHRLVSLNEVGGDPRRFGVSVAAFHHANQERTRRWPHGLLATSTHDAKRGEDVRARIHVLSELPETWRRHVHRWQRLNESKKGTADGEPAPSANDEYLFYQTLAGAWPMAEPDDEGLAQFRGRIREYLLKAVREAKLHTSWVHPNEEYEEAVAGFVERVLATPNRNAFLADFLPFQQRIARFGVLNGLAQTLLRLTAPGVPDTYQGSELWDLNLVDPDNRRPVDYGRRRALLDSLREQNPAPRDLLAGFEDGRIKLDLVRRTLGLRRARPGLFRDGDYIALECHGDNADHLCAFARRHETRWAVTVVGRWFARLTDGEDPLPLPPETWADTWVELPDDAPAAFEDVLTGRTVEAARLHGRPGLPVRSLLGPLPAALLTGTSG